MNKERIPALDGVRGIAILLVMVHHYAQLLNPANTIDRLVLGAARAGWVGVDLFFVLSGFLITGILYDTRNARNYFPSFYARRFLRIFPLYYAALVFFFVVLPLLSADALGPTASRWPWFWLHLSNFLIVWQGFPSRYVQHFWSLAIEEQFYLVWPLVVVWLPRRSLTAMSAGIIVAAAALRGVIDRHGVGAVTNYVHTLTRADALAMGAALALLLRDPVETRRVRRTAPWILAVALPAAVFLLTRTSSRPAWLSWGLREQILGYSFIGIAFTAAIAWSVTRPAGSLMNRTLACGPLRFLGRYSYGIYVIHLPLDTLARSLDLHVDAIARRVGAITPSLLIYLVFAGATSVALAVLSWNVLEKRFLSMKRHFEPLFSEGHSPSLDVPSL